MHRWNIDSLQLWMTLAAVYYQTSACLQLVWTDWVDLTLKLEGAKRQPSQPWCVGTAQLTSEADAASKPVPEGNIWHQGLASAAPGSC